MTELSKRIDCLSDQLRNDGLIAIKQPDVFSQARLTRFRTEFENQFQSDLSKFELVLAARINRLDAATTTSQTSLGAALAPGSTSVSIPQAPDANFGRGIVLGPDEIGLRVCRP